MKRGETERNKPYLDHLHMHPQSRNNAYCAVASSAAIILAFLRRVSPADLNRSTSGYIIHARKGIGRAEPQCGAAHACGWRSMWTCVLTTGYHRRTCGRSPARAGLLLGPRGRRARHASGARRRRPTGKGKPLRPRLRASRFDLPACLPLGVPVKVKGWFCVCRRGTGCAGWRAGQHGEKSAGAAGPLVVARQGR